MNYELNKNMPTVRFPEFKDGWEEVQLGKLIYKTDKKNKKNLNLPVYSINNTEGFLPQSEQFEGRNSNDRGFDISIYKIINKHTFAYNPARINVGSIGYSNELDNILISSLYVCFKTKEELNDKFLSQFLNTYNFNVSVLRYQEGGVRQYLFYENLFKIKISFPSIPEQTRIAHFFTILDNKINHLKEKKALLEDYKKGMMQKIFSQEIRFKPALSEVEGDDDGKEFPEWEEKKLGEIGEFKNGINKSKGDFGFGVPFINLMDVFGKPTISNQDFGLVNANEKELKQYEIRKGDVLFIRSSVKKEGVGETSLILNDMKNTVYSGFLIRFRDEKIKLDLNYKEYCFSNRKFREDLISLSSTSANTNINQESLNTLKIYLPCIKEQTKIANFLSKIDDKIKTVNEQIEESKEFKKGLLQKMYCV